MMSARRIGCLRILRWLGLGLLVLLLLAAGASALSNRSLPTGPATLDRLDPLDTARLEETLHLKQELGERVWPGWGAAAMPVLLWNQQYAFLIGYAAPPEDWVALGGATFAGQPVYRQPAHDPQNFAVRIGPRYAASMATKWEADHFLITQFRQMMPGPLKPIFPYRLLIQPSEVQITGVLHESFHVYQAEITPARFADAELAYRDAERYRAAEPAMADAWSAEIELLIGATQAETDAEARQLAQQFLAQRAARRKIAQLDAASIAYERRLEWLEGLAKYVEIESWRQAATTPGYAPLAAMMADPDFQRYGGFRQRWAQERDQLRRQARQADEVRFYYTGMAQAVLLDRLVPGWKTRIFQKEQWLETLLLEAAQDAGR